MARLPPTHTKPRSAWEVRSVDDAFDDYAALNFRTPYGGIVECGIEPPRRWYQFRLDQHPPKKHLEMLVQCAEYPPFILWRVRGEAETRLSCLIPGHENKEARIFIRGVLGRQALLEIAAMRLAFIDLTLRRGSQGPSQWTALSDWGP